MERLGLGVLGLVDVKLRQAVEAIGDVGVVRSQCLLPDRQRAPIERLGLRVLTLG